MDLNKTMKYDITNYVREDIFSKLFEINGELISKKLHTKCNSIITDQVTEINRNIYYNIFEFSRIVWF